MRLIKALILLAISSSASAQGAFEFNIATFNTESASDTQPFKVAETIRSAEGVQLWAFQEVWGANAVEEFTVAAASAPKTGRDGFKKRCQIYLISNTKTACHFQLNNSGTFLLAWLHAPETRIQQELSVRVMKG